MHLALQQLVKLVGCWSQISWAIGFAIPAVAMAIAIVVFVSGSSLYTHVEPTERCGRCVCACALTLHPP